MTRITRSPGIEKAFEDVFPVPIIAKRAPTSSDTKFPLGQSWVRKDTGDIYTLSILASGQATWKLISQGGAASFTTLTTTGDATIGGDLILSSVATQLQMNGGAATDFIGVDTLIAGTVTVANTNIAAGDRIFLTRSALNASPELGDLITTISAATSFTVTSYDALGVIANTDVSSFDYFIVRQS